MKWSVGRKKFVRFFPLIKVVCLLHNSEHSPPMYEWGHGAGPHAHPVLIIRLVSLTMLLCRPCFWSQMQRANFVHRAVPLLKSHSLVPPWTHTGPLNSCSPFKDKAMPPPHWFHIFRYYTIARWWQRKDLGKKEPTTEDRLVIMKW